jgi:hypothetical protein
MERALQLQTPWDADVEEIAYLLEEDETIAAIKDPGERLEAATRQEVASRLWIEERYDDAFKVAAGGPDPQMGAELLQESVGDDEFREYIFEAAERAHEESVEAAISAVNEGVAKHAVLQTEQGVEVLTRVFEAANLESPPTVEQADALVRAAARVATEEALQADEARHLEAWDEALAQSEFTTGEHDTNTREVWAVPGGEIDPDLKREISRIERVAEAISAEDPKTAAEQVENDWSVIREHEEARDSWDASISSMREAAAQAAAANAAEGI